MKKSIKQKLAMYRTVESTVDAFTASWSAIPAFVSTYNVFKEKVIQLQNYGRQQTNALVGVSVQKDVHRDATADQTMRISSALVAFAAATSNEALKAQARVSASEIRHGSRANALQAIDLVLELANEHVSNLADFAITQTDVDALQTSRDELNSLFYAPRQAIVDRKYLTAAMDVLVDELDDLLKNTFDPLVVVIRVSDEIFFRKYSNARTIVHFGATHSRVVPMDMEETPPEVDDGTHPLQNADSDDGE